MRVFISLLIGWAVGFALLFSGAGWWAPVAGAAATSLALVVSDPF